MNKIFALVIAAAMGLSSAAFAAEEAATAPVAMQQTTDLAAPAKSNMTKKHVKKHAKKHKAVATAQKAQAAKKDHKKVTKNASQKSQSVKKHHKKPAKSIKKTEEQPAA